MPMIFLGTYFVPIGVPIRPLRQSSKPPSVNQANEGVVVAIFEKLRHNVLNEHVRVMDLPCPAMRHPADNVLILSG